jgi:hypothetical protein
VERMKITKMIDDMTENLENIRSDAAKFDHGNMAAGTRVRIALQGIKTQAHDCRVAINERKKK